VNDLLVKWTGGKHASTFGAGIQPHRCVLLVLQEAAYEKSQKYKEGKYILERWAPEHVTLLHVADAGDSDFGSEAIGCHVGSSEQFQQNCCCMLVSAFCMRFPTVQGI
jgi:hypothetical protein